MFKRVIYDNWSLIIPVTALVTAFIVYGVVVFRTLLLKRDKTDHLASLPLDQDEQRPS